MSYTPTVWQSGDVVTSEKLNKLENGVENADANALPAVTTDDNGDVLAVVSGAWAKSSNALPPVNNGDGGMILQVSGGKWSKVWPEYSYVVQETAGEDEDHPGTYVCSSSAGDLYDAYHVNGVMINESLVINATCVYDDVSGNEQYTFTVLSINNGTLTPITYTADSSGESPHYTAS